MAQYALAARIREQKGKGAAKKLRKDNKIPAIFYGPNTETLMLTVDSSDLKKIMKKTAGENIILRLQIESEKGNNTKMVVLKELLTDPIKDNYLHADFYEISMDKDLTIDVPIRLINTPEGVTNGGILQHVRREITISCLPDKLVDFIELDVSKLDIGESLHIQDIELPEGIKSIQEGNLTVAVVNAPSVSAEEEEAEEMEEEEGEETEEEVTESDSQAEEQ
ncbi:50S ribosomal protein L25/general stress protein Ctc [Deltaproteobacteria bacterium]|nr:50S ribosomal protein L25/general stress protein Ctc [Deltaproteobacteria bacterium]